MPLRERNVHISPGEGLMLREVIFNSYNNKNPKAKIDWTSAIPDLESFKKSTIVPHLVLACRRGLFSDWLEFWDDFPMDFDLLKKRYYESPDFVKDQKQARWKAQTAAIEAEKAAAASAAAASSSTATSTL